MKETIRLLVLGLLAFTALGKPAILMAQDDPAVVHALLLGPDPARPDDRDAYLALVEDVRQGSVPFHYIAVRIDKDSWWSRRLADQAFATGETVELSLRPLAEQSWLAVAVRSTPYREPSEPFPAPLVANDAEQSDLSSKTIPGQTAAATPTAPWTHQVVELVNEERQANGNLSPLKSDPLLDAAAGGHSDAMANRDFFAHCDLDTGKSPWTRMDEAGYNWNGAAENIAAGYSSPAAVVAGWMASSGHRANILSGSLRELGVGNRLQSGDQANIRRDLNGDCTADSFNHGPYGRYWTQNFGRRNSVFPVIIDREAWQTSCADVKLYLYGVGWAQDMRFSNDGSNWSPWEAFSPDIDWSLDEAASGTATVYARLRNGGTVYEVSDTINIAAGYPAGPTYDVSNQTVSGAEDFESCGTISAGNFDITATGAVTFTAREVVLEPGFRVAMNGEFRVARW